MTGDESNMNLDFLRLLFQQQNEDEFLSNYRNLADFFPGLVYVYDAGKGKIGYVNKKFTEILGYTALDLDGFDYDWKRIIYEEDAPKYQEEFNKFLELQDSEEYSYENRLTPKDGGWRYFRTKGTVLSRTSEGKPAAILFIAQDITDQFKNTEELLKTKELIRETEILHKYGIYTYDVKSDVISWSEGVYHLFEVDPRDAVQKNYAFLEQFVPDEERDRIRGLRETALEKTDEFENEFAIVTVNNHPKILLETGKIIRDEAGKATKCVGTIRDVTRERTNQRELEKNNRELDRSNKELEEFAYVASHDMQEPLRKIITFSGRLREKFKDQLGSEGAMYLERMNGAANNMRILIENLLEISRTARTTQPFVETDLNQIIRQVKADLELSIEEHAVVLNCAKLPVVQAIPSQMLQLFSNLLNNAIKFRSPGRRPEISITSRELDAADREQLLLPEKIYYEIAISDNGIGFEQEYAERVFQIFQRLHGKSEYPGSGIGLSICKKVTDKHNGVIYARSQTGAGTTFYVVLPQQQS